MKKLGASVFAFFLLVSMIIIPVNADETSIFRNALCEAYDSFYIQPFNDEFNGNFNVYSSNVGKTYLDEKERYDSTFAYESIHSLWQKYALNTDDPIVKNFKKQFSDGQWDINCDVYPTYILEEAYNFKFGLDIWDILNNCENKDFLLSANDDYIVIRSYGRGERMPGLSPVIEKTQKLSDNVFYFTGYLENIEYTYAPPSNTIHIILEKGNVAGKEIFGYRYLSITPPNNEVLKSYSNYTETPIVVGLNYDFGDDYKLIEFDQPPILKNNRTLVPVRAIFEAMGCTVYWNEENQEVDVWQDDNNVMTLWIDNAEMWTPTGYITLDVPPQVLNNRTLVPVRAISESMGAKVEWKDFDDTTMLVNIYYNPPYSGTTSNEFYYRLQKNIINFGYLLGDNPYHAGLDYDFTVYYYMYTSDSNINYCIDQYLELMEGNGYEVKFLSDEHGAKYYSLKGHGYYIELIDDYLLEHIQVEIKEI